MVLHTCPDCSKVFTKANFLSRHRFREHNPRCCRWCQYQSSRVYLIRSHVQRAHPSLRLDKDNKVWRLPQDPVGAVTHAAPRKPLANITNQSSIMAYSPGPATTAQVQYIPSVIVPTGPTLVAQALSPALPGLASPSSSAACSPGYELISMSLEGAMSPAVSEWEVGGDDYAIEDVGVPASVPVPPLLISGLISPSGLPAPSLVTSAERGVGMELCVSPLEQMDVTSEQSKQAGQISTLDSLSSDPPESSPPVSFAVERLVSAGAPLLVTGSSSQTLQASVDVLSADSSLMPVDMTSCLPVEEAVTSCASTGVEPLTPPVDVRLVERKSSPDTLRKNSSSSVANTVSCLPVVDAVAPCVSTDVEPFTPSVDVRLVERKSSPSWEDLGASLAQLLQQHEKAGPTPYSDEIKKKADNYQRLLAQYKCRPFLEETATTSVPASDVARASTTSTTVSVTAQPLPPVTFTEPESVTPAPASSSIESVTPVPTSSSPELVTTPAASSGPESFTPPPASSGPESVIPPPASSGPESVTPPPAFSSPQSVTPPPACSNALPTPFSGEGTSIPVPGVIIWSPDTLGSPPPRRSSVLPLLETAEYPLDLSTRKKPSGKSSSQVLTGSSNRWQQTRHQGEDMSMDVPTTPEEAWPKLAAAVCQVDHESLKMPPQDFRSLQNDPALFFLGAPSHYLPGFQARQLERIRERARRGQAYLGVRHAPAGVHSIWREERAILPDGTIYECQATWIEDPAPRTRLSTRTQAFGRHIDRDMAKLSLTD